MTNCVAGDVWEISGKLHTKKSSNMVSALEVHENPPFDHHTTSLNGDGQMTFMQFQCWALIDGNLTNIAKAHDSSNSGIYGTASMVEGTFDKYHCGPNGLTT